MVIIKLLEHDRPAILSSDDKISLFQLRNEACAILANPSSFHRFDPHGTTSRVLQPDGMPFRTIDEVKAIKVSHRHTSPYDRKFISPIAFPKLSLGKVDFFRDNIPLLA